MQLSANGPAASQTGQLARSVSFAVLAAGAIGWTTSAMAETPLVRIPIPGGAMGENGILRITTPVTPPTSGNPATLNVRLGGIGGTLFLSTTFGGPAIVPNMFQLLIQNRGVHNSQLGYCSGLPVTLTPSAVDTGIMQELVISGFVTGGADSIKVESYLIELWNG
jgi:hypothetical protein